MERDNVFGATGGAGAVGAGVGAGGSVPVIAGLAGTAGPGITGRFSIGAEGCAPAGGSVAGNCVRAGAALNQFCLSRLAAIGDMGEVDVNEASGADAGGSVGAGAGGTGCWVFSAEGAGVAAIWMGSTVWRGDV